MKYLLCLCFLACAGCNGYNANYKLVCKIGEQTTLDVVGYQVHTTSYGLWIWYNPIGDQLTYTQQSGEACQRYSMQAAE